MNETPDATAIFAPLWKRKWLILCVGILVAAATYAYYKRQPTVYTASTQLYLAGNSEAQGLLGSAQGRTTLNDRAVVDQATLINSSTVGEPVHRRLREAHDYAAARGKAHATSVTGSDFITIATEARTAKGAVSLADAYAQAYVKRQRAGFRHEVRAAIADTRRQLARIEASQSRSSSRSQGRGSGSSPSSVATIQAANLVSKINQLEADLSVAGVQISSGQIRATLRSPTPKRNAIFGFVLGILLAAATVYAVSRFDRRLRSLAGIEAVFQAQILAALPAVREPIVHRDGQPAPAPSLLEPLRRLHTTLQLGDMLERDRERPPRMILFVSADAGDGKSTLVADLALVQREAGERAAVLEADLRRPVQARLLDVSGSHGLVEVLAGRRAVGEALQRVGSSRPRGEAGSAGSAAGGATATELRTVGSVSVLVSGGPVANPPALLAGRTMADLLHAVADDFDHVLIDAPAPLGVSDVIPLLGAVDGIVLVARIGHTRETSAQRLMQLLSRVSSAPVLGVVANSVPRAELERYGFSPARDERRWQRKPIAR